MNAHFSLFKIAVANKKINVKESIISNDLSKETIDKLLNYSKTLINSDDFININGKLEKLTFFSLDNINYLISVIPSGINTLNEDLYTLKIMHFSDNDFNPFNAFINDYFNNIDGNKDLLIKTNNNSLITRQMLNDIDSNKEKVIATYIELLLKHDKPIFIYADNLSFYLALPGFLLPYENLYDISYTFGGIIENMLNFKLIGMPKKSTIDLENIYYIDFKGNDYPNIEIGKYAATMASLILNSIEDAKKYKNTIEQLIERHNIDANRASMLNNLINGKIETFTNPKDLSIAIKDSNNLYNNSFIASAIYLVMNKFRINNDMLVAYKYVYEFVESSRDEIIKLFFSNLNKFGISINNNPKDFLYLIETNAPFDMADYYDYLKKYDLFNAKFINGMDNFNEWYLLLDAICKNIKKNNLKIVPNSELEYYIYECVKNKKVEYLDLVSERISLLNKKASSRLMYFVFEELDRKIDNYTMDFGIYYTLKILERMNPSDAIKYYEKSFNSVYNRKEFVSLYVEREEKKPDYYNKLNELFLKDNYNQFLDMKDSYRVDKVSNFDISYLEEIYNKYYLSKVRKDNIGFTDKAIEYIKAGDKDKILDRAFDVYNRYYKNLDDNYKDRATFIRKMLNIVYTNIDLVFENDLKYYDDLFEIDLYLQKKKEEKSIYLDVLKAGLDVKKAYINDRFRYEYFKNLVISKNRWFDEKGNEYYIKYYLRYLLSSFLKFLPNPMEMKNSLLLEAGFNSLFTNLKDNKGFIYNFVNTIINYENNEFKLYYLFFILFQSNNLDKAYEKIRDEIEEKKKGITKIYKEYYRVIKVFDWSKDLNDNTLKYINSYMLDNLGFFRKIIWRLFKR